MTTQDNPTATGKRTRRTVVIASLAFSIVACGLGFLLYLHQMGEREREAFDYARTSEDTTVLRGYLERYPEADGQHRDIIQDRLRQAQRRERAWSDAVVSNSLSQLRAYVDQYPNSIHQREAENRIDSLSWVQAKAMNTVESYQAYLDHFGGGAYYAQAEEALRKRMGQEVRPEEREMVRQLFRKFFQSVNARDEESLLATCEDILTSFLGKPTATLSDVASFLQKIYKPEVAGMTWYLGNDFEIDKREVGDEEYEYQVAFSAIQEIDYTEGPRDTYHYRIQATVSPDGKVSSLGMTRLLAEGE